jgi:hypothetical protein
VGAGPTRLLINNVGGTNAWIGLRLTAAGTGRDALGARVEIRRPGASPLWRRVRSDGSYASANDPRVLAGLGPSAPATLAARVAWPDGKSEEWTSLPTGRYTTLVQGQAK